jgi:replication factor C subunit 3/5
MEDSQDNSDISNEMEVENKASNVMDVEKKAPERKNFENLPWVEKYRPSTFNDLISHDNIIKTLDKLISSNKLPHLLFYGPPGTGKTSTILATARKMNGPSYQNLILELNASDDRKINVVREQIKDFASTKKIFDTGIKLIILDEADAMTNDAQAALRRVIEKYSANTRFCLICNHVNKIIPAIQSRCTKFRFGPLDLNQVRPRLEEIIATEKLNVTEDGIRALLRLSKGDMRKVLNVLQSTSMAFDVVNEENVYNCTGNPLPNLIREMVNWMLSLDFKEAYDKILEAKTERGIALQDILRDVHTLVTHIKFTDNVLIDIYSKLGEIEQRLNSGANEKIQLGALVSLFQVTRESVKIEASEK